MDFSNLLFHNKLPGLPSNNIDTKTSRPLLPKQLPNIFSVQSPVPSMLELYRHASNISPLKLERKLIAAMLINKGKRFGQHRNVLQSEFIKKIFGLKSNHWNKQIRLTSYRQLKKCLHCAQIGFSVLFSFTVKLTLKMCKIGGIRQFWWGSQRSNLTNRSLNRRGQFGQRKAFLKG